MGTRLPRKPTVLRWAIVGFLAVLLAVPALAAGAMTFSQIVVFGDSLSDSGNAFSLRNMQSTPPYDTLDALGIPEAPYARGGHHFSNGATWVEQFARPLGLAGNARPAFQSASRGGSNYAVGGARAYEDGKNANLLAQVDAFLADVGSTAPADSLYVIEFGGNDVRDALEAISGGGDYEGILSESLTSIGANIGALYVAGARKFLVWNAPDLRLAPAILALDSVYPGTRMAAGLLGESFNAGLETVLASLSGLEDIEIRLFDVQQMVNDIAANPGAYDLEVVDTACVTPNLPPFECQEPDSYMFWDGIHSTRAVHGMLAQGVALLLAQ